MAPHGLDNAVILHEPLMHSQVSDAEGLGHARTVLLQRPAGCYPGRLTAEIAEKTEALSSGEVPICTRRSGQEQTVSQTGSAIRQAAFCLALTERVHVVSAGPAPSAVVRNVDYPSGGACPARAGVWWVHRRTPERR